MNLCPLINVAFNGPSTSKNSGFLHPVIPGFYLYTLEGSAVSTVSLDKDPNLCFHQDQPLHSFFERTFFIL